MFLVPQTNLGLGNVQREREKDTLIKNDQKSSPVCHPFSMARF